MLWYPRPVPACGVCGVGGGAGLQVTSLLAFEGDATPFVPSQTVENIGNLLHRMGYQRSGNEIMYNGHTGRKMEAQIFLGPNYYQVRCGLPTPPLPRPRCMRPPRCMYTKRSPAVLRAVGKHSVFFFLRGVSPCVRGLSCTTPPPCLFPPPPPTVPFPVRAAVETHGG
jgi:hypothetical protein